MAANSETNSPEGVQFFEGVEKLIEIWFTTASTTDDTEAEKRRDLRNIPR